VARWPVAPAPYPPADSLSQEVQSWLRGPGPVADSMGVVMVTHDGTGWLATLGVREPTRQPFV
jgi:hypothetical protein